MMRLLLNAAHIIPDAHPDGSASVDNGICLSKIHHKAYDANLIGIGRVGMRWQIGLQSLGDYVMFSAPKY